jgi:ketosteroid isomerase-like protein
MPSKDSVDPQTAQEVRSITRKYEEAYKNHDVTTLVALFTEDAGLLRDDGPVYGRQAIEKYYADMFQKWHFLEVVIKHDEKSPHPIGAAGNDVWDNGKWSLTIQGQGGGPRKHSGYWSSVKVREGDTWKTCLHTSVPGVYSAE